VRRTSRIPRVAVLAALAALALLPTATAQAGGGLSTNSSPTVAGSKAKLVKGKAIAPADAPRRVQKVIAAANRIRNKPYVWGGGHGNWKDKGYDCSGAVSYALAGAGLLQTPLTSGAFMGYGEPGPGQWLTIYANPDHVYAVIAGLRWDTVGDARGSGPRWHPYDAYPKGFVARHVPGL
jgi:hypothetical protein